MFSDLTVNFIEIRSHYFCTVLYLLHLASPLQCQNVNIKLFVFSFSPVKQKETPQKATSAVDFFGSSPIERSSRKVFATKRKEVQLLTL